MTTVPLKYVASINAGQSPPSADVRDLGSGQPFLQGNAEFGHEVPAPRFECDSAPKVAHQGDVLLSVRAPVGALNLADRLYGIGRGLNAIRAAGCDRRFLWWWMHGQREFLDSISVGSTYKAVTAEDVANLEFPIVALEEQRRIADFLDAETSRIDRLVGLRKRQLSLLRERFSTALRDLIGGVGRNAANGTVIDWLGPIDQTWSTSSIGRLSRTYMGTTFPHAYQGNSCGDYPVIKVSDFRLANDWLRLGNAENWVSKEVAGKLGARIVPAGSVLYARVGAALLLNRRVVTTCESIVDDNVRAIHFRSGCATYWANLLTLLDLGELANPGPVPSVSESQVATVRVPIPSDTEQMEIGHQIDSYRRSFSSLESVIDKQLRLLGERRQSLITAAVTGQFDVTTASGRNLTQGV
ncbi:restriction endonuclease subunit S [Nocardia aurantiaca]|uniref:Type I restriction modification DNA specificity domain-containing protein n=1 Tax=Nocardia aurantiaca TaxID=2675850 RepID=A0A6I3KTN9_9NOCA|nr:restriction endonuclease subunit S [Nocardia aurantiaca]MTE14163.1 hypothetical protein [Nocardia aurantiaca]